MRLNQPSVPSKKLSMFILAISQWVLAVCLCIFKNHGEMKLLDLYFLNEDRACCVLNFFYSMNSV